jgi:hypothetical protein
MGPAICDKVDRSSSFNTGSHNPRTPENQSLHSASNAPSHEKPEISPGEMASTGPEDLSSNHATLGPALEELQQYRQDSLNRYLDSLHGKTTNGPAQDDDYMTKDSGDDTSVYSESIASDETIYKNSELHVNEVSAAAFESAKRTLINRLMQEVWVRFDRDWTAKFTACAGSEITPSKQTASTSAQGAAPKRQREEEDDDDNSSSNGNGRAPKRSIPQQTLPGGEGLALSCPFRKRDPRKYRLPEYKTCALSSWKSVGRVKSGRR